MWIVGFWELVKWRCVLIKLQILRRKCEVFLSLPLQILDVEVNKLQQDVSNIADQGRLLAHKIDLDDHDKAIRIYRQVEDMKVSKFSNQNHLFLWSHGKDWVKKMFEGFQFLRNL